MDDISEAVRLQILSNKTNERIAIMINAPPVFSSKVLFDDEQEIVWCKFLDNGKDVLVIVSYDNYQKFLGR